MIDRILTAPDLDLPCLLAALCEDQKSEGCLLMTVTPQGTLSVAAAHPGPVATGFTLPIGYGVMGLVAVNGKGVVLDDDSPRDPAHRVLLGLEYGGSVARLCAPVTGLPGDVVGVLSLHRETARPYTAGDLDRLAPIARVLGLRLEAERLRAQELSSRSERDALIAQAISAQEAERRRIAGDLHDGVTQALVSLDYHLSAASDFLVTGSVPDAASQIAAARSLSALAYDETRAAISGLHSLMLDDLGVVAALESLAQTVTAAAGVEVRYAGDTELADLPDHAAAALYRIAQEAVNNAVKHADADHAAISLRRSRTGVVLTVTDDGAGFDPSAVHARAPAPGATEHFGLASIAERCALLGATLRIDSAPGRGTAVIVDLSTT